MLQINSQINNKIKNRDNLVVSDSGNYNQINYRSSNICGEQNDRVMLGESSDLNEKIKNKKTSRLFDESTNELDNIKNKSRNRQSFL